MRSGFNGVAQGAATGSLVFWLPILLARLVFGAYWGPILVVFPLTFLTPLFACFILELFSEQWKLSRLVFAAGMLFGIWATGPFWITLANTSAAGEGFHMAGAWSFVTLMTATFPLSTIPLATYHGSLGALLLTTTVLPLFALTRWSFQPIARRCVVCRVALFRGES